MSSSLRTELTHHTRIIKDNMRQKEQKGRMSHGKAGKEGSETVKGVAKGVASLERPLSLGRPPQTQGLRVCTYSEAGEYARWCFGELLGLLFEDYNRVKEETEKQSFLHPKELSVNSLFCICVGVSSALAVSSLRAGAVPFISESPAPSPEIDTS